MQSYRRSSSSASAASEDATAVISTSSPLPISATIAFRWSSSSSTTSRLRTPRAMNCSMEPNAPSRSSFETGFSSTATAPDRSASRWPSAVPETMCTGMCLVAGCRFRCSSTCQPSTTGRPRSRMIASGRYSCASETPWSPRVATIPLKPRLRAIPSSVRANSTSSSMISTTRSSPSISSRSSPTTSSITATNGASITAVIDERPLSPPGSSAAVKSPIAASSGSGSSPGSGGAGV